MHASQQNSAVFEVGLENREIVIRALVTMANSKALIDFINCYLRERSHSLHIQMFIPNFFFENDRTEFTREAAKNKLASIDNFKRGAAYSYDNRRFCCYWSSLVVHFI